MGSSSSAFLEFFSSRLVRLLQIEIVMPNFQIFPSSIFDKLLIDEERKLFQIRFTLDGFCDKKLALSTKNETKTIVKFKRKVKMKIVVCIEKSSRGHS